MKFNRPRKRSCRLECCLESLLDASGQELKQFVARVTSCPNGEIQRSVFEAAHLLYTKTHSKPRDIRVKKGPHRLGNELQIRACSGTLAPKYITANQAVSIGGYGMGYGFEMSKTVASTRAATVYFVPFPSSLRC